MHSATSGRANPAVRKITLHRVVALDHRGADQDGLAENDVGLVNGVDDEPDEGRSTLLELVCGSLVVVPPGHHRDLVRLDRVHQAVLVIDATRPQTGGVVAQ